MLDLGVWSYTTLTADVIEPFEPTISDPESVELAWVPVDAVDALPLHPGFAESWPALREFLRVRPTVVVDIANVMGSVPDGWWRDRAGAATGWLGRVAKVAAQGVPAAALGLTASTWYPRWVAVIEGASRSAQRPEGLETVQAAGSGDDEIIRQAELATVSGGSVTVVTSDRALGRRVEAIGATVRGARWIRDLLPE